MGSRHGNWQYWVMNNNTDVNTTDRHRLVKCLTTQFRYYDGLTQCFPNFFARGPLMASKNKHESIVSWWQVSRIKNLHSERTVDRYECIAVAYVTIHCRNWYDIFNCNWVATRWQLFSTHIHTNNTGNVTKQTIHRTQKYIEHKKYIEQHKKHIEQHKKYIEQHKKYIDQHKKYIEQHKNT